MISATLNTASPRAGRTGMAVFNEIVTIVRNRTKRDFTQCFNAVLRDSRDLLSGNFETLFSGRFLRLTNRVEASSGLSPVAATEFSVDHVGAIARRFAPQFSNAPAALQWEVISRASDLLGKCGVPLKIFNRGAQDQNISDADRAAAEDRSGDVLRFLEKRSARPNPAASQDIGEWLQIRESSGPQIFRTFYSQVKRLIAENGMTVDQAFEHLKETQPLFWTLAMLSFSPDAL